MRRWWKLRRRPRGRGKVLGNGFNFDGVKGLGNIFCNLHGCGS